MRNPDRSAPPRARSRPRAAAMVVAALAFLAVAGSPLVAQPGGRIDLARMRPVGLLVDAYSYMTPPHNAYYFHHIDALGFRLAPVRRGGPVSPLAARRTAPPLRWTARGEARDLERYLDESHATGLLVLRGDTVLIERYRHGASRRSRFVSQSVGKSIVSILVGVAVDRGQIASIDDPVTRYLPELATSGYRDATIRHVLEMSTGVDYSEDYRDSTSGAARIGAALVSGQQRFADFVRSMQPTDVRPGTAFQYQSVNTQLLAMLLERATGMPLDAWTRQTLWEPLGAESDAFYYQAKEQPDICAFACFNATLRDYGRVGLLMLREGELGGRRIVSAEWVRQSTTPSGPHLMPADGSAGGPPRFGYAFQWWIPPGAEGAYLAIGIFGQMIYVNPTRELVIVQTSAWPTPIGNERLAAERAAFLRAVEEYVGAGRAAAGTR